MSNENLEEQLDRLQKQIDELSVLVKKYVNSKHKLNKQIREFEKQVNLNSKTIKKW